jgi:GTPase SAR1 family protein
MNKLNILFLGERKTGKTSLLNSLIFTSDTPLPHKYIRTLGIDERYWQISPSLLLKIYDIGYYERKHNETLLQSIIPSCNVICFIIEAHQTHIDKSLLFQYKSLLNSANTSITKVIVFTKDDNLSFEPQLTSSNHPLLTTLETQIQFHKAYSVSAFNKSSLQLFKDTFTQMIMNIVDVSNAVNVDVSNAIEVKYSKVNVQQRKQSFGCFAK